MTTAAEKRHLDRVARSGCALCHHLGLGETPAEVHHPRFSEGMGQRASHWLAIGLCSEHHRGKTGLHGLGTREFERRYKVSEAVLLAITLQEVEKCFA